MTDIIKQSEKGRTVSRTIKEQIEAHKNDVKKCAEKQNSGEQYYDFIFWSQMTDKEISLKDSYIKELTEQNAKLVEALEAIAIPDGDIGTTIWSSELQRCQSIAHHTLEEIKDNPCKT